jgi:hypothetical protein
VPVKPGVAFAGAVTPIAAIPATATATAVLVIAPQILEGISRLIDRSLRADRNEQYRPLLLSTHPQIFADIRTPDSPMRVNHNSPVRTPFDQSR